jgi:maltose alpha-D-glucosyltransferase/alpha-amylase
MLNTMKFWLDIGIDGFRVDAVPYLCTLFLIICVNSNSVPVEREGTSCENLPETHDFLRKMRSFVDDNYPGAFHFDFF